MLQGYFTEAGRLVFLAHCRKVGPGQDHLTALATPAIVVVRVPDLDRNFQERH
jgi:hypothetical protein